MLQLREDLQDLKLLEDLIIINAGTNFVSIANDIKEQASKELCEINSIYIADENQNEISLLHDFTDEKI